MNRYKGRSPKSKDFKPNINLRKEKIKELISLLETNQVEQVKDFLKRLLYTPRKPKVDLKEIAAEYKKENIENATQAEKLTRILLEEKNVKFVFQHVIYYKKTFYIVDFFLPFKKLVVEIDGGYHTDEIQIKKDKLRTKHLKELGIEVVRYTNEEVFDTDNFRKQLANLLKEE